MVAPTLPPMMDADVSAVLEYVSGGDAEGVAEFSYILTAKVDDYTCRYLTKSHEQPFVYVKSTPS